MDNKIKKIDQIKKLINDLKKKEKSYNTNNKALQLYKAKLKELQNNISSGLNANKLESELQTLKRDKLSRKNQIERLKVSLQQGKNYIAKINSLPENEKPTNAEGIKKQNNTYRETKLAVSRLEKYFENIARLDKEIEEKEKLLADIKTEKLPQEVVQPVPKQVQQVQQLQQVPPILEPKFTPKQVYSKPKISNENKNKEIISDIISIFSEGAQKVKTRIPISPQIPETPKEKTERQKKQEELKLIIDKIKELYQNNTSQLGQKIMQRITTISLYVDDTYMQDIDEMMPVLQKIISRKNKKIEKKIPEVESEEEPQQEKLKANQEELLKKDIINLHERLIREGKKGTNALLEVRKTYPNHNKIINDLITSRILI